ncbi:MAG: hypothetical protein JO263_11560 [Candidatus Eremiobacteraeota bacterium]|nr:hypothetical protein [Candidatus Eremiobacteraeota bacterium]
MNSRKNFRLLAAAAVLSAFAAGCTHQSSPSAQIDQGFAPFASSRNQAVGLVATTKHSLGSADLNTLAVAYTSLQEKANAYAGFMVEAITTSSFDPARNAKYAADLQKAIAQFDKAFAPLAPNRQQTIADAWVPSFAQTLQVRWDQYSGVIAKMTPQTKADLIATLKRQTVWPNYEDIATERVVDTR